MGFLKIVALAVLLSALSFLPQTHALPIISNISIQKANLWIGESAVISLNCTDNSNSSITDVYASTGGPNIILPPMNFSLAGNVYTLTIPSLSLDRSGFFNATISCQNNASETASSSIEFNVSNISSELKPIATPLFIGDIAEIDFVLKKDNVPLNSSVSFDTTIDSQPVALLQNPPYDTNKGWILKIPTTSLSQGNHTVNVVAKYDGAASSKNGIFEVRRPVEFFLSNIDRSEVQSGNEITASVSAIERLNPIVITSNYISAQVDSTAATVSGISQTSPGNYAVRIVAPPFSSGTRQLKIIFNYGNYSTSFTKSITYVVPVSGKITGSDGKGIPLQFVFRSGSIERKASTDASGAYSTYLPPGNYSLTMTHDASTLELDSVKIDDFDDPIKYYYLPDVNVPGIKEAGLFVYEVALEYSGAHLRMKYDEGKVSDESKLNVYECKNWNSGRKECISGWSKITASIDVIRNIANADVPALHAYAIGVDEEVSADVSLDKDSYILNETMKLAGVVRDAGGAAIGSANITAFIEGDGKPYMAVSGAGGVYSIAIPSPYAEGKYVLDVNIEKPPYVSTAKKIEFSTAKSRGISIVAPDTVRLKQGESATSEFTLVNTGQADISDIKVSISGLAPNYYILSPQAISMLKSKEEKTVSVTFNIPQDAAKSTVGASFDISGGIAASQSFGVTISAPESNTSAAPPNSSGPGGISGNSAGFSFPTAFASFAPFSVPPQDFVNILLLAIVSFSSAIFFRKKRLSKATVSYPNRSGARNVLFEIKKRVVEPEKARNKRKLAGKNSEFAKEW